MRNDLMPLHLSRLAEGGVGYFPEMYQYAEQHGVPSLDTACGLFLSTVMRMQRPAQVLEIGCGIGVSTRFLHMGWQKAQITALDSNRQRAEMARQFTAEIPQITVLTEKAEEFLRRDTARYDFVFVDSIKKDYTLLLSLLQKRLTEGGVMLFDDVLMYGMIAHEDSEIPRKYLNGAQYVRDFLCEVRALWPESSQIVPLGNGMVLIAT